MGGFIMNDGKRFEMNVEDSIVAFNEKCRKEGDICKDGISLLRLYDPGHGFGGVSNICDYVVYSKPHVIFLELKSTRGNRLNFSGAITDNQYKGLKEQAEIKGTIPGFLIKFDEYDVAYFLHINQLERHRETVIRGKNKGQDRWSYQLDGKKSITPDEAEDLCVALIGDKKQVNWDYDVECLIRALKNRYGDD